jgi:hypothetical protein
MFCHEHGCRVCFINGLALNKEITEIYPRNVCKDHPLCIECDNVALNGTTKCEEHFIGVINGDQLAAERQCSGLTKKKARCKTKGLCVRDKWYCKNHAGQDNERGQHVPDIDDNCDGLDEPIVLSADMQLKMWPSVNYFAHRCGYKGNRECTSQIYCGPVDSWLCAMHREIELVSAAAAAQDLRPSGGAHPSGSDAAVVTLAKAAAADSARISTGRSPKGGKTIFALFMLPIELFKCF